MVLSDRDSWMRKVEWNKAVDVVRREFAALPDIFPQKIGVLAAAIKKQKRALYEMTRSVEGEMVCELCKGGCCETGAYHFTVVDLLVYLADGRELFAPCFAGDRCPYLGHGGCMMGPEYRPFNCITFHCEHLEKLLPDSEVDAFYAVEKLLRGHYSEMETLFGNTFAHGLLSNYERSYPAKGTILFA